MNLDIIIPIALDLDWPTYDIIVSEILEQHNNYGFTRFALATPGAGWRSVGYPPKEHFINQAELFLKIKNTLTAYNIECGWWITATLKSGHSEDFIPQVKTNGENHPFSNCPLDPNFRKIFSENIALFAKIAKPAFIITEDDYSIGAADGCFCKYHLDEFAKRQGKYYSRDELTKIFSQKTPQDFEIIRKWRELLKDSLVGLCQAIRNEVDKESPEIPIGYMQAFTADKDGDCTLAISKALAGKKHIPFSRLYGTFYGGVDIKHMPFVMYHPLYTKQHINCDFRFYHESDTFPHTRFFTSGAHMRAIMSTAYSYGFDGSTFQTQQLLDKPNEETAYGKMFAEERNRFNIIHRIAKQCELNGVQIDYDPFWNTVDSSKSITEPLWTGCISRFGIPYTTLNSTITFWDEIQAKYADDTTIKEHLSKSLFLDGDAAKCLCARGYGKYIGIEIDGDVLENNTIVYDLGAREIICEKFIHDDNGRNMPSAHMFSPKGNGKLLKINVIDKRCEIISEFYTYQKNYISPAMTRFENELGGKVIVMGITLDRNNSQSLFNYRRQRLIQELITWCSDEFVFVKEAPDVFLITNKAVNPQESGFLGMMTLINLCEDTLNDTELHLPPQWKNASFSILDKNANWHELNFIRTADGIIINEELKYIDPIYILVK